MLQEREGLLALRESKFEKTFLLSKTVQVVERHMINTQSATSSQTKYCCHLAGRKSYPNVKNTKGKSTNVTVLIVVFYRQLLIYCKGRMYTKIMSKIIFGHNYQCSTKRMIIYS